MDAERGQVDKAEVRRAFDRAAPAYDRHARLQREVATRLLERVDELRVTPTRVLDVGSGTGECTELLARRFRQGRVVGLDLAPAMVEAARARRRLRLYPAPRYLVADMESLPHPPGTFDFIFSNLSFQWAGDPAGLFAELYRVGRPGTPLLFSSFGPDTLRELRDAWGRVDDGVHVNRFMDMHDVGDLLMKSGFAGVVMDVDWLTEHHDRVESVMGVIKAIGAHNALRRRPRGLTGRGRLAALREAYEVHRRPDMPPMEPSLQTAGFMYQLEPSRDSGASRVNPPPSDDK